MTMTRRAPAAIFLAAVLAGVSPATAQPAERRFDVRGFDAVELAASDSIRVVRGPAVSVVAGGDPRAVAALAIEVHGDTLHVGRRPGTWRDKGALVTVTMPTLRAARVSGSGDIRADAIGGREFAGSISGSGSLFLDDLRIGAARFGVSGSGSIVAAGRADTVAIDLDGSGRVDTRALPVRAITIDLGGSGSVAATASRSATIGAGGSGTVRVTGGARCDIRKGGSATVRCD